MTRSSRNQMKAASATAPLPAAGRSNLVQRKCACGGSAGMTGACDQCSGKKRSLQRQASGPPEPSAVPSIVHDVLRSPGQPLDAQTRAFMEPRFGHNFGQVRVHANPHAAESARAVNALAYTVGRDIVFGAGQYAPGTRYGQKLIAHELAHVIQQSATEGSSGIQYLSRSTGKYESEAEIIANQVISGSSQRSTVASAFRVANTAPVGVMRSPGKCEDVCKEEFKNCKEHSTFAEQCIGSLSACLQGCEQPSRPKEPPKTAPAPKKDVPPHSEDVPKTCDPPKGPGKHPETVSQTLVDRWMGKHSKEGDPGEGCREIPYIAGKTEKVCTIGYGHQIPDCPIVDRATGKTLSLEDRKKANIADLKCACEGAPTYDCKGKEAETKVRRDGAGGAKHIHEVVPVDLDQAQFDAMVDITVHVGHVPSDLLDLIKKYWCTNAGKDYVRSAYLKTALTRPSSKKIEPGFVKRRQFRVWPPSSEKK